MREKGKILRFGTAVWAGVWTLLLLVGAIAAALHAKELRLLWQVYQGCCVVEEHYMEEVDHTTLTTGAMNGLVAALQDPYAAYFDEEGMAARTQLQAGKMVGIGVSIYGVEEGLCVARVYPDTPAEQAGICVGDIITAADGVSFAECSSSEALALVGGEAGSTVRLTILRGAKEQELSVERREVTVPSVEWAPMEDVAYIRISTFRKQTAEEFSKALAEAQEAQISALVFDLRFNTGGLMDEALAMLDELLPEGVLATKVEQDGTETVLKRSDERAVDLPMAVLVDENTASASELFAAVLRDFDAAVIVGKTTYGKGVMQTTYPLSGNTALKLTTAKFYPPSGESFNGVGITPDVAVETATLAKDFGNPTTDEPLSAAIEVIKDGKRP